MKTPLTGEIARIDDELSRAYDGEPWHGPSLREVLRGVSAETAAARPVPGGHSIWEIVVHLAAWDEVVARRITASRAVEAPDGGNFPPVTGSGPAAWAEALAELDRRHQELRMVVAGLAVARLGETVAGKDYPVALMLHGVAQHRAYHAGQIALLKELGAG
jgi:uncharacterized damage-inducible protein DinB